MSNLQVLEELVWDWAVDRGIPSQSSVVAQLSKTLEEVAETLREVVNLEKSWDKIAYQGIPEEGSALETALSKVRSEFGDILVTWIIAAGMVNMNMEECLEAAYEKIHTRTGRMINGVWVKDTP